MPAAAVIRRVQTLSGIIGRKEFVGGFVSWVLNLSAQPINCTQYCKTLWFAGADGIHGVAVECVDIMKNTNGEGSLLGSPDTEERKRG